MKISIVVIQLFIILQLTKFQFIYAPTNPSPTMIPSETPTPNITPTITPSNTPTPNPSIISPSPTPTIISNRTPILSEIMACPSSGNEWIELYNPFNEEINLNNWYLNDSYHQIHLYEDILIPAKKIYTIEVSRQLNNDGDSIFLHNPQQNIIQSFSYENCQKDSSFIFHENQWLVSLQPTHNAPNIIFAPTIIPTPSPKPSNTPAPKEKSNQSIEEKYDNGESGKNTKNNQVVSSNTHSLKPKLVSKLQLDSLKDSISNIASSSAYIQSDEIDNSTKSYSFNENTASKKGVINVIIGGTIFMLLGISGLYEQYNQKKYLLP